jgi:uncharacterized protein
MKKHPSLVTRRTVLGWGAAAAGCGAGRAIPAFASTTATAHPAFQPTHFDEVHYSQVSLDPGPMQTQFEQNHALLLNMNEDGLLRPFRVRGGLPAPGEELGGWYSTDGFAPADPFGQWISSLARMYAVTRDQATYDKIDRLIRGYAATIDPAGRFYQNNRFPAYFYDKMVRGLSDAALYADHPTALEVLQRTTDTVMPYLPPQAMPHQEFELVGREDFTGHVWDESYTMPENLFIVWQRTGDRRYYDLARRFIFHDFFGPLSRGENALPGRHAYSHMNSLGSAAISYLALGQKEYLDAARNGFRFVQEQSFATGGWGPSEHFVIPGTGTLGESLIKDHASFETPCGAYAHLKLTRHLMRITGDSRHGDSMEQVLYNTVLGARPIEPDGRAFYYSDYTYNGSKFFHDATWPCCSGTLPMDAADYRICAYFSSFRGVYVNLYSPSTLSWRGGQATCSLRQTTNYPYSSQVQMEITTSSPSEFSVFLRIPGWARSAALTTNGMRDSRKLEPGSFAELHRTWKTGDRIELDLPFTTRLEPVDAEHPDTVALITGPLVLMAIKSEAQDPATKQWSRGELLAATQAPNQGHEWRTEGALTLKPFADIQDESYTTYLQLEKRRPYTNAD